METHWWHAENERIICDLCPRRCELPEGKRGFCFVRQNVGGQMVLTTYGRSTGFCIDPIEKKPLNHFLPGTPVLSFGTAGCNLGCKFCQNWDISKSRAIEIASDEASPEAIIERALAQGVKSLAFTYNDPVIWAEYAIDCARLARDAGIKTVAVTAGYITPQAREDFFKHIDATNVDLKAFTEKFYTELTLSHLEPVLETLKWLKHSSNTWFEITNLVIPGHNDSADEIARMSDWIAENLGVEVPLHFSAFHPDFKMMDTPATSPALLRRARDQAIQAGLKYVYLGNVHDSKGQSTYCPECKALLIERDWYKLGAYNLTGSHCKFCNYRISGVFAEEGPGDWGPKRLPLSFTKSPEELIALRRKKSNEIKRGQMTTARVGYSNQEKELLLNYSRGVVVSAIERTKPPLLPRELDCSPCYGVFVSLKRGKQLRACCGRWGEISSLGALLRQASEDSALRDSRLPSISREELPLLTLEVSLMYDPQLLTEQGEARINAIQPGVHGLVMLHPHTRGLLLPQVAVEQGWNAELFLNSVSRKAGLPESAWRSQETQILTFKAEVFAMIPKAKEFEDYSEANLLALLAAANHIRAKAESAIQMPRVLADSYDGAIGVYLETRSGLRAAELLAGVSPLEVTSSAARRLPEKEGDPVIRISLLTHPIRLSPDDYPERLRTIQCVMAEKGGQYSLSFPGREDPFLTALSAGGIKSWKDGEVRLTGFVARTVVAEPNEEAGRSPAVAGRFYPADYGQIEGYLKNSFRDRKPEQLESFSALMLPHAGWQYSGSVTTQTLIDCAVPDLCLLIGPKHTPHGARWSVSADSVWRLPGMEIPVEVSLCNALAQAIPGLELERDAHRQEHAIEVMLPFLRYLNPKLRIVPIVIGGNTTLSEAQSFAKKLSQVVGGLAQRPLLIISSDMNHFEDLDTTIRKDGLALERVLEGDPAGLFEVCTSQEISMCGVVPAVIVMETLRKLNLPLKPELIVRATSAEINGDQNSVVGYAGVRFG